jgi:hypothetical protein
MSIMTLVYCGTTLAMAATSMNKKSKRRWN